MGTKPWAAWRWSAIARNAATSLSGVAGRPDGGGASRPGDGDAGRLGRDGDADRRPGEGGADWGERESPTIWEETSLFESSGPPNPVEDWSFCG